MRAKKIVAGILSAALIFTSVHIPAGAVGQANTLSNGLVLYSDFEDTANDLSQSGRNGTVTGTLTYVDGVAGKAVQFPDARGSYVNYGKSNGLIPATENFSISLWYRRTGDNHNGTLFANKNYASGSNVGIAIGTFLNPSNAAQKDIRINFSAKSGSRVEMSGSSHSQLLDVQGDMDWHHIVVNYDRADKMTCYIDGQSIGALSITGDHSGSIDPGLDFVLGAYGNSATNESLRNSTVDELRIYNRLLREDEILSLYTTPDGTGATVADPERAQELVKVARIKADLGGMTASSIFTQEAIDEMVGKVSGVETALEDPDLALEQVKALVAGLEEDYREFLKGAKPLASFHLVSDVHIPSASDTTTEARNYIAGMDNMKDINPDTTIAFVNAGDFTNNSSEAEYNGFYDLTGAYNPVDAERTLIIMGNHDVRGPNGGSGDPNWVRDPRKEGPDSPAANYIPWATIKDRYETKNAPYMAGSPTLYHSKELGGYTFIMLNTEKGLKDALYLSPVQLDWVEATMKAAYEKDPGKPVFIVGHNPLNDTHWMGNTLDGFDGILADGTPQPYQSGGDARLKDIMAKYPIGVYLSGHIHNEFGRAEAVMRPFGVAVDIPSFGQGGFNSKELGTGYEVQIYEDGIVFRAVNYVTGQWYPQYDLTVAMPGYATIYQQANAILNTSEREWYSKEDVRALDGAFQPLHAMLTKTYDQSGLSWNSTGKAPRQLYQGADHEAIQAAALTLESVLEGVERLSEPRVIVTLDDMRETWRSYLLGGSGHDLDLDNPAVAAYVDGLNAEASDYWNTLVKSDVPGRSNLWSDLDMTPINDYSQAAYARSGNMATTFVRLRTLATAWGTVGTDFYQSVYVRDEVINALDHMTGRYFKEGVRGYGNWYHWEITAPTALMNASIILYDELTPAQIEAYAKASKYYAPYCNKGGPNSNGPAMTGGNLLLKANGVAQAGILLGDETMLTNVKDGVKSVLVHNPYSKLYSADADGFYADGSYIQHQALPYIGGYGRDLYNNLGVFLVTLKNSDWEIAYDDGAEQIAYDFIFDGVEPFIYETRTMDMVSSRDVTRKESTDRIRTARILSAIMPLRGTFPTQEQNARFDSMMKYYLSQDPAYYYARMESITSIQMAAELVNDPGVQPRQGYSLTKTFAMDKTVHITPDFGFGISMHSNRTYGHEIINNEGKRTWNMSDGMFFLYDADEDQFGGGYWATVDPTRLPGITAEHIIFNNGTGDRTKNIYPWTGGASLDGYGAAGSHFRTLGQAGSSTRNGTDVKKSWFMFGDRIVMVGSDITSTTGNGVETIVDNRKLLSDGSNTIVVDGAPAALNETPTVLSPKWISVAGNVAGADVGYYFPGESTVSAIKETRTGDWSQQGTTTGRETNTFATFWFDHGVKPSGTGYEYVLLPGRNAEQTAAYAAAPDVEILQSDSRIHAARDKKDGVVAANFWEDGGSVAGITVDKAASVVLKSQGDALELAVAEPNQNNGTVVVTLATSGSVRSKDGNVTVLQTEPFIKLSVDTQGKGGGTSRVSIQADQAEKRELVELVSYLAPIRVPADTPFAELGLPSEAVFLTNDMTEHTLPILWSRNGYAPAAYSKGFVIGTPVLGEDFLNSTGLTIQVEVIQGTNEVLAAHDNWVQNGTTENTVMGSGGTGTGLTVKYEESAGYHRKALFSFNLTGVPADREISFKVQVGTPLDTGLNGVEVHLLDGDFDQAAVTWNNRPQRVAQNSLIASFTRAQIPADGVLSMDVTALIQAARSAGKSTISFELAASAPSGGKNQLSVHSVESTTATQRPALAWEVDNTPQAVDKRSLEYLVSMAETLDGARFLNYRAEELARTLADARQVLESGDATMSQVNDAEDALMSFLLALRTVPVSTP